jgi:8-oxo-dGTP pyrophosphatase MutT (NUDIX family)
MSKHNFILWSGKISLENIDWMFLPNKQFNFSPQFIKKRENYWNEFISKYPHVYDGNLLFLEEFLPDKESVKLFTRAMKFSSLVYLESEKIPLSESLGSLGFQIFIRDPSGQCFLIGKRAQTSDYKPGHYTIPGGMFEVEDIGDSVANACLREIEEEISLPLDPGAIFLTNILGELSNLGTVLLLECTLEKDSHSNYINREKLSANEEWEDYMVYWYPFDSINKLNRFEIMEGLLYHWLIQNKLDS